MGYYFLSEAMQAGNELAKERRRFVKRLQSLVDQEIFDFQSRVQDFIDVAGIPDSHYSELVMLSHNLSNLESDCNMIIHDITNSKLLMGVDDEKTFMDKVEHLKVTEGIVVTTNEGETITLSRDELHKLLLGY